MQKEKASPDNSKNLFHKCPQGINVETIDKNPEKLR